MESDKRLETFLKNKNSYDESDQKIGAFIREEKSKQNIFHGNMIQLYKDKHYREKIIKKAEKKNYDTNLINKAREISNTTPFDIQTITVSDLECLYSVEVFVKNVSDGKVNVFSRIADRIEEMILGKNENEVDFGGDSL